MGDLFRVSGAEPFSLSDLEPGDQMFGPIGGAAGELIVGPGQVLLAPWKHRLTWRRWWKIRHCGIITQAAGDGGPKLGQAEPGGFEEIEIGPEHWTPEYVYIRPRWRTIRQGTAVAVMAKRLAASKTPYAFEDYAAIAAHRLHLPVPHLDRFISATRGDSGLPRRAICSQANDACLTLSGGLTANGKVFDDGRLPQDVVPAELYLRLLELEPDVIIQPGRVSMAMGKLASRENIGGIQISAASEAGLL